MLHSQIGKEILATHILPTVESYSFTAHGTDCIAFEWLSDVLLAETERVGGYAGLMTLFQVLAAIVTLLLYFLAYQRSKNAKAAFFACLLVLPLMATFLYLRAQLIGVAFLLITLICLERFRAGHSKAIWVFPPLFLIWVNVHATFLFGFAVMALYWASGFASFSFGGLRADRWTGAQRLRLLAVALFSLLAVTITPYGTRLAAFPLDVFLHAPLGMSIIDEYQPLRGVSLEIFLALLLLFMVALVVVRPVYRLEEAIFLLFGAYEGWAHGRYLVLFVFAFTPMLATLLARWAPDYEPEKDKRLLNAGLMVLLIWGMTKLSLSPTELHEALASSYPEGAASYIRTHHIPGPMFNPDSWGDYLIWKFNGQHKVFVDTRTVPYEEAGVFADFARIFEVQPDTRFLLRKYGINSCLLDRGEPLVMYFAASPDWQLVYEDRTSAVFARRDSHQRVPNPAPTGQKR